jgi:uncharacterized membrane protein HdeD (DUF308 family)
MIKAEPANPAPPALVWSGPERLLDRAPTWHTVDILAGDCGDGQAGPPDVASRIFRFATEELIMSANQPATLAAVRTASFGELKTNWGWLFALGSCAIILGTYGLYMTFALTLASVLFFGFLILAAGAFQFIHAFTCQGWKGVSWHVLIALLYVLAGGVIIMDPLLASEVLTLVLAGILIAIGLLRMIMALQLRPVAQAWYWPLLSGLVSVLLGGLIIAQWPASGIWVIGLFVAIELIFNGWSYLFIALAARTAAQGDR